MVKLGSQSVSALYLGESKIAKAMLGDRIVFSSAAPPTPTYTITASIDPAGSGTVAGAGTYPEGAQVTIKAVPEEGYEFTGWQEGGQVVSENAEYTFPVSGNRTLVAVFKAKTVSRLPEGYTEVEYILSDEACGIDTGYKPIAIIRIDAICRGGLWPPAGKDTTACLCGRPQAAPTGPVSVILNPAIIM